MTELLVYFVLTPILIAVFMYLFSHANLGRLLAVLFQFGLVIASFLLFNYVNNSYSSVILNVGDYRGLLGISLGVDYISSLFVLITNFIFLMSTIYSYKEKDNKLFWFLMFVWQAAIVGVFLTRDLFNRFVLMEVGTMIITILIVYRRDNRKMYHSMLFLMINIVAVQFYMFGMGLIYMQTGVLDLYAAAARLSHLDISYLILPYALFMTFVAFKAALIPMSHWMPKALAASGAPSSFSAILAGIHITSGLYMFIRFSYMFNMINARPFFIVVGILTSIFSVIMAISAKNIKIILSYLTLSQIGLIIVAFNIGGIAYTGALFHTANQILFHGALFFAAGIIAHNYKTLNIHEIDGVWSVNKIAAIVTFVGLMGAMGIPFFNGNISMHLMFGYEGVDTQIIAWVINIGIIIASVRYGKIILGTPKEGIKAEKAIEKNIASLIIAFFCVLFGIGGSQIAYYVFNVNINIFSMPFLTNAIILTIVLVLSFIFTGKIKNDKVTNISRDLDVGFKGMVICIGIFFISILITTYLLN
ncbi:MAG: hypothetical protein FWF50_07395 [Defluviitaleaceae bacterium]|nr:hypothetical protein [Defluviitaleaceae bacterium]